MYLSSAQYQHQPNHHSHGLFSCSIFFYYYGLRCPSFSLYRLVRSVIAKNEEEPQPLMWRYFKLRLSGFYNEIKWSCTSISHTLSTQFSVPVQTPNNKQPVGLRYHGQLFIIISVFHKYNSYKIPIYVVILLRHFIQFLLSYYITLGNNLN